MARLAPKTLEDRFVIPIIGAEDTHERAVPELPSDF